MSNDRTAEFMSMARTLADSGSVPVMAQPPRKPPPNSVNDLRNFHKTAAAISKDIASTSAMLQELTRLVQSKSLFVDNSVPINNLVVQIKHNVENLNARLEQTEHYMKSHKTKHQSSQEALNVVGQLQEEFVQTTSGFKKVLQLRTDSLKVSTEEKQAVYGESVEQKDMNAISLENKPAVYGGGINAANPNSSAAAGGFNNNYPTLDLTSGYNTMSPGESTSSQLPRPHGARGAFVSPTMRSDSLPTYSGGTSSYYGTSTTPSSAPLTPLDIAQMEQESGQTMQLIPDQDYLRQRADAMETVESNIVELGKVFQKLATMVSEHGQLVRRVEDNVDDANMNINLSMETLTDTLTQLRTNKALFLKVFSVLVIFIILFITFFA